MAKPDLFHKRKFRRLAYLVGNEVGMPEHGEILALGFLEKLWQEAYVRCDDIIGDRIDVELAAGWQGETGKLASALRRCGGRGGAGFIEPIPGCRGKYRIHDFWEHAPDFVKKRRDRQAAEAPTPSADSRKPAEQSPPKKRRTGPKRKPSGKKTADSVPSSDTVSPTPSAERQTVSAERQTSSDERRTVPAERTPSGSVSVADFEAEDQRQQTPPPTKPPAPPPPPSGEEVGDERRTSSGARTPTRGGKGSRSSPDRVAKEDIKAVFDAHDVGRRAFAEVMGEPFRPHSRKLAKRRKAVAEAIRVFGVDVVKLAARNLVLSTHHHGQNENGKRYLDIEYALRRPETYAEIFEGKDELFPKVVRYILGIPLDPRPEPGSLGENDVVRCALCAKDSMPGTVLCEEHQDAAGP